MREAIHQILTDVSDSFSTMIDMALANEIRVRVRIARRLGSGSGSGQGWARRGAALSRRPPHLMIATPIYRNGRLDPHASPIYASDGTADPRCLPTGARPFVISYRGNRPNSHASFVTTLIRFHRFQI